jgi:hypothetical protein
MFVACFGVDSVPESLQPCNYAVLQGIIKNLENVAQSPVSSEYRLFGGMYCKCMTKFFTEFGQNRLRFRIPLDNPMNHEWLKILVSVLAGMFAGLVADPIRSSLAENVKRMRLERALWLDCLFLNTAVSAVEVELAKSQQLWASEMLPVFKYHWEKNREMFFDDLYAQGLRLNLQTILFIQQKVQGGQYTPERGMEKMKETLSAIRESQEQIWKLGGRTDRLKRRIFNFFY